jgi:hypothetical protein
MSWKFKFSGKSTAYVAVNKLTDAEDAFKKQQSEIKWLN